MDLKDHVTLKVLFSFTIALKSHFVLIQTCRVMFSLQVANLICQKSAYGKHNMRIK